VFAHNWFILLKREKSTIFKWLFCDLKWNSSLLLSFYTKASVPCDLKVFLPHFFLRMVSLVSPISHFYQPCVHTAFRGRVNKEESVLKLVFYIILLQYYKFVLHKRTSLCSPAITWRRTEIVQNFRGKSLPFNFNVEKTKCFHKQTRINSTEVYNNGTWFTIFRVGALGLEDQDPVVKKPYF
jgi:hypothetical protein